MSKSSAYFSGMKSDVYNSRQRLSIFYYNRVVYIKNCCCNVYLRCILTCTPFTCSHYTKNDARLLRLFRLNLQNMLPYRHGTQIEI